MKKIWYQSVLILFVASTTLLSPVSSFAQEGSNPDPQGGSGNNPKTISLPNPLSGADTFSELLKKIVDWLIAIGTPLATLMIIVGALQMVFAQGDPEKFAKGKKTILYTAIGYGIILIGWGFVTIIQDVLSL